MGERGFDAQLLGHLVEVASDDQVHLVQRVAGGIDPGTVFGKHASSLAGLVTELPRVHAALFHHHRQGQPAIRLLNRLCANGVRLVRGVRDIWGADPTLDGLLAVLAEAIGEPPSRDLAGDLATRLQRHVDDLPALIATRFKRAWAGPAGPTLADSVADEVACLLAFADRDPTALEHDLTAAARAGKPLDADTVWRALLPDPAEHVVAGVVRGTAELRDLRLFHPGTDQRPLRAATGLRWGMSTGRLHKFVSGFAVAGEACVVTVTVTARDKPSAGRLARRTLAELLDQYLAGTRFAELELDPRVLVARVGTTSTLELGPPVRGTPQAKPLTTPHLPEEVRRSLRMAHIAARTDSPSAAAALSWSAVEACGLANRDELAAALSLQCLRQAVVQTHRNVRLSVVTRLAFARNRTELAALSARQARRAADACPPGPRREELRDALAHADKIHREVRDAHDDLRGKLDTTALEAAAPYRRRFHLDDLNTWVDVLTGPSPLDDLLPHLHPLAGRQAAVWRSRLASPRRCAAWLRRRQQRMTTVLDALYATRNLTLHAGVFQSAADTVHGAGAVLVTDLVLELLGHWYNTAPTARQPVSVVTALARRQAAVLAGFARGTPPAALDFESLTAPVPSAPWRLR
ncbi:hypothetical protein GCM10022243_46470 [Saccharothrix violaceirubra]|uniref:Uncharacterized protein n=1 Tax=Saccharothrix violaceirubra TaxID=413306 RepID=A0A7W7T0U5_9PSEU|nr:hypothetical protein [Saccharothrix violaceirubra]MBB4964465.1 hypothetical protein [Saccharothrix violaceirubra]